MRGIINFDSSLLLQGEVAEEDHLTRSKASLSRDKNFHLHHESMGALLVSACSLCAARDRSWLASTSTLVTLRILSLV